MFRFLKNLMADIRNFFLGHPPTFKINKITYPQDSE